MDMECVAAGDLHSCDGSGDAVVLGHAMRWLQFTFEHGVMGSVAFLCWVAFSGRVLNVIPISGGAEGVCSLRGQTKSHITHVYPGPFTIWGRYPRLSFIERSRFPTIH
ncbi:glycoprotein N [Macropodid alphaherpesvirus 1]|uniref:Glycoprotein N n=1 Tax=Macropodid alphaherpesvirus 1 TaxID=137443 RepID=A0A120HUJ3_9ALPH|nr:glycoprotein N [Macropodid alphaherpesvirus 1]AMB17064.1 glycoprotein N [Macropodid alphaherpesvirus 1]